MTAIVGYIDQQTKKVYIGGDSAGVSGYDLHVRADQKVFVNDGFAMGFTTSFRMGQLLRYAFEPPLHKDDADLMEYMVTDFVDTLRKCLKEGGFAEKKSERETGGTFLVGHRGRLFYIEDDYQVGEMVVPYSAVGCGDSYALGALRILHETAYTPEEKVRRALEAAETYSNGVRGPFHIVSV